MYFEIENTPERVKRTQKKEKVHEVQEECPRLILAPFSRPPQVVFENVLVGTTCEKELEVLNPSKQAQQITLSKCLPPGLVILLPEESLEVEPETCYCVTMQWTPTQLVSQRETIRFINDNRGRHDIIVVLKSIVPVSKSNQPKFKTSPGKIMKKTTKKKSPVNICKKKMEAVRKTVTVKKTINVVQSTQYKVVNLMNKENTYPADYSLDSNNYQKCPFDSPSSLDFNTSEVFSNMLRSKAAALHDTYDKTYSTLGAEISQPVHSNVLKPSNKQVCEASLSDVFDNLTFTPLKSVPSKNEKLDKGPRIVISVNSESDFDDSEDVKNSNKENKTRSIICVTSCQQPTKWLTTDDAAQHNETPIMNKKIPNTSSPKDMNSPNFSINTDFSRISDLSFFPQRCSTERKMMPILNNETHENIVYDSHMNTKLSSDTYTKESPNTPLDCRVSKNGSEFRHLPYLAKESYSKMCRQSLFKEQQNFREFNERNYLAASAHYPWHNDLRADVKSPPRSLTPPLQSIPEESVHFPDTQVLDRTDKHAETFTINQTFEKPSNLSSVSVNRQSTWSKRDVRAEPALWKTPAAPTIKKLTKRKASDTKESLSNKINQTMETNRTINESSYLNYVGNVYTQSSTANPFLSSTYYYDKEAVASLEKEFKRWLNYVLTPPADLDSNVEQKVDVGKAWIENRNKEVPLAPTKEQVSSTYHNSHRLESLRRSARALLRSPEMTEVFNKLQAQIEKKLIAIRNDKNLHLDIGLQKLIMDIILSYNPLWLRIGLETIYGVVLPLKSNNDIEGLTNFVIQRMFKNPFLRNKNTKNSAPNMLLPAYMEAIKKFTLKKFFMLVFFLDQAKQKKLIPHDPCLFRRNALYKESKAILFSFTKDLIAGIGDITKHLRPLGYVVSHKQSYLDEYTYAVNNIAADIRDGVRLTKVMEIILMRSGLLHQLRTPAISRLQKIHNVQVALNALKEANFVIEGDISAADIADGHREKTLSLLWQLIHVFRAPLFEKSANVIQIWWRKKYDVILKKRKEEERLRERLNTAASTIQCWWRRIQYDRMVEQQMHKMTTATIVLQKYWRMWLCRSQLRKLKSSVAKISEWYINVKLKRQAKETLQLLRSKREELRHKSAALIQAHVRRWLCVKRYKTIKRKVTLIQSVVRRFLAQKKYNSLKKAVTFVQRKYRGKILMRKEMNNFTVKRNSAILIQSFYRMSKQRKYYKDLKKSVLALEKYYTALILMRTERTYYLKLKETTIKVQACYRRNKVRIEYLRQRSIIVMMQRKIRANQAMKRDRANYLKMRNAAIVIQNYTRAYQAMKLQRASYILQRNSAIIIQRYYRAYLQKKTQRRNYLLLKKFVIQIQTRYRSLLAMRRQRNAYLKLRNAVLTVQRRYRAKILMKETLNKYQESKKAAIVLQRRFRAMLKMREERLKYMNMRNAAIVIQNHTRAYQAMKLQRATYILQRKSAVVIQRYYRAYLQMKTQRSNYLKLRKSVIQVQTRYRSSLAMRSERNAYLKLRNAVLTVQRRYRAKILMREALRKYQELKKAAIVLQRRFRAMLKMREERLKYMKMRNVAIVIQNHTRAYQAMKLQRATYILQRKSAVVIQRYYRAYLQMKTQRSNYLRLRKSVIQVQTRYRSLLAMQSERNAYLKLRNAVLTVQRRYRAKILMREALRKYQELKKAAIVLQRRFRALFKMREERLKYMKMKSACVTIQNAFRAYLLGKKQRQLYLKQKESAIRIQRWYRFLKMTQEVKQQYFKMKQACRTIETRYKAYVAAKKQRQHYVKIKAATVCIQKYYRNYLLTKTIRKEFLQIRTSTIVIQQFYRSWLETKKHRQAYYLRIRQAAVTIQTNFRAYICRKQYLSKRNAAVTIQKYYRNYKLVKSERERYVKLRCATIKLQAHLRSLIQRKRYLKLRNVVLTIQSIYRFKKLRAVMQKRKEKATLCIQKNVRRYLTQSRYKRFLEKVIFIQILWRSKLITRRIRCEFLQKRTLILKLQAAIRGYLTRKEFERKKEKLLKLKEEQRRNRAASKIQALFKGNLVRARAGERAAELRWRWRAGALQSRQETLQARNRDVLNVLFHSRDIQKIIHSFKSLELLTEVMPMLYTCNAASVVRRVYVYMGVMNRSVPSVEVLKSGAAVLANLARYRLAGPKIYERDHITDTLKMMLRFSKSETELFCTMCTYLWLFSKYQAVKQDLTEFLHMPENHKMLVTIKVNVDRVKRMENNRNKFISRSMNHSHTVYNSANVMPALEPDYGIVRKNKPRYFQDAPFAISCLFDTYGLKS